MTSAAQNILELFTGLSWSPSGSDRVITYSFLTEAQSYPGESPDSDLVKELGDVQKALTESIFTYLSSIINVTFVEVAHDPANGQVGDIAIGLKDTYSDRGKTNWDLSPSSSGGDIYLKTSTFFPPSGEVTDDSFKHTMLHEIVHALGIKHSYESFAFSNEYFYSPEDGARFSIAGRDSDANIPEPLTLQLYDISALQFLYGAREKNISNNIYDYSYFTNNNQEADALDSIWDTGGVDEISAASASLGVVININDTAFSSIGDFYGQFDVNNLGVDGYANNISIALNVSIENATGGLASDLLIGNEFGNVLKGGAGDDLIFGDEVVARFILKEEGLPQNGFQWWSNLFGSGAYQVAGADAVTGEVDDIQGGVGNDFVFAGGGDDQIDGGNGSDFIDGGVGYDVVNSHAGEVVVFHEISLSSSGLPEEIELNDASIWKVRVDRSDGESTVTDNDFLRSVEEVRFGSLDNYAKFIGNALAGGITFDGGSQASSVGDRLDFSEFAAGLVVANEAIQGGPTFRNFEEIIGTGLADQITLGGALKVARGGTGGDVLTGSTSGGEQLFGDGDVDQLDGGGGGDRLEGGAGADKYIVHSGDVILDTDGLGNVKHGGVMLEGGTREEGTSGEYIDGLGNKYYWSGNPGTELIIRPNGETGPGIRIENFDSGVLGIVLATVDERPDRDSEQDPPVAPAPRDPLVLDLDGDGVELIGIGSATFDTNGDGIRERVGWVGPDDGLLARDLNGDGQIAGLAELFGSETQDGFSILSAFDSNADGKIDAADAIWSDLRIWIDADSDGVTDAGELTTLAAHSIESIGLTKTAVSIPSAGNRIEFAGSYRTSGGVERDVGAVLFDRDQFLTQVEIPENFVYPPGIRELPDLNGYGLLADFSFAMANDATLASMVTTLVGTAHEIGYDQFREQFEDILFRWAGADSILPGSRGGYVDAQQLTFIEKFFGGPMVFQGWSGPQSNPATLSQGSEIGGQFQTYLHGLALRFATQIAMSNMFIAEDQQLASESPLWALSLLEYDPSTGILKGNVADAFAAIVDNIPSDASAAIQYVTKVGILIRPVLREFYWPEHNATSHYGEEGTAATQTFLAEISSSLESIPDEALRALLEFVVTEPSTATVITGTSGADSLAGAEISSAPTLLLGGKGNDTLSNGIFVYAAGDGHDTLLTDGPVYLVGIASTDVVVVRNSPSVGDVSLEFSGGSGSLRLPGFVPEAETLTTFTFADGVVWTPAQIAARLIDEAGTAGNDTIEGFNRSDDTLEGRAGNDILIGHGGDDIYVYTLGDGRDIIRDSGHYTEDNKLVLHGISPADVAVIKHGVDAILLFGPGGANGRVTLEGQFETRYWVHTPKITSVEFDGGVVWTAQTLIDNAVVSDGSNVTHYGTTGDDVITGTNNVDVIDGDAGNDILNGGSGNDVLLGGLGDDTLNGGTGNDTMIGGAGSDAYVVDAIGDVILEEGDEGTDTVSSSVSYALADNVENLTLTGTSSLNGTGNSLANIIVGTSGNNVLAGLGGADALDGGGGTDTVTYAASSAGIAVSLAAGTASGGDAEGDTFVSIENIIGTNYDDVIEGSSGNNTLNGGAGEDTVSYANASVGVTVSLATSSGQNTGAGTDTITNFENLTGSEYADTLTGSSSANILRGLAGNDTLNGGAGADTMIGGTGNDVYVVDNVADVVVEEADEGTDTVQTALAYVLGSHVENLTLTGVAGVAATGNAASNTITGNSGDNVIEGLGGADVLAGGSGTDTLSYSNSSSAVTVDLLLGTARGGDAEGDTFSSFEAIVGSAFNDFLTGNASANVLRGGAGNDTLDGGGGADDMFGGAGADIYVVDYLTDEVVENADEGFDTVRSTLSYVLGAHLEALTLLGSSNITGTGNALDNALLGNSGNNTLAGLGGADVIDGSGGVDTVTYAASASGVSINLATGAASGGDAAGDTFISIENITGSAFDDLIQGDAGNNALVGGNGTDTVSYSSAGSGVTVTLATTVAQNTVGAGSDALSGFENLTGSAFNDVLTGSTAANVLVGLDGNDTLNGGLGADTLVGGLGNDTYVVDNVGDVVTELADEGTDVVQSSIGYILGSNVENLLLTGSDDVAGTGNALANTLTGNTGDNVLSGLGGADALNGGGGIDTASYAASAAAVTANLAIGVGAGGDAEGDTYALIENLAGSEFADNLTGDGLANTLYGGGGNDTLVGGGGSDILDGGLGDDSMSGGLGNDRYIVDSAGDTISEASNEGTDTVESSVDIILGSNLENLVLLGAAALNGTGNALANTMDGNGAANILSGGDGNDTIRGNGGSDTIYGGAGNDTLDGGADADALVGGVGNDTYVVDHIDDVVVELSAEGSDRISSSISLTLVANVERLDLTGYAAIDGTGNELANEIVGNSGNNVLTGAGGDDVLTGGGGADTLVGGIGNDTYVIDATDTIIEYSGEGTDTVQSSASYMLGEHLENLTLSGSSSINGTGNAVANIIVGNSGANSLYGLDGDDTLNGGSGADLLVGGAGRDTIDPGGGNDTISYSLVSESTGANRDLVQGFNFDADKLDFIVIPTAIAPKLTTGTLNEASFDSDLEAAITASQLGVGEAILFDPNSGTANVNSHQYLIIDTNGIAGYQAGADLVVQLVSATGTISPDDFI